MAYGTISTLSGEQMEMIRDNPGMVYINESRGLAITYREKDDETGEYVILEGNFRGSEENVNTEIQRIFKKNFGRRARL